MLSALVLRRLRQDVARQLAPLEMESIYYRIISLYGDGDNLSAESFPLVPNLFEQLDADGAPEQRLARAHDSAA